MDRECILVPPMGAIILEGLLAKLAQTAEMTRLKEIKQLATLYLFHSTARHTRFTHSCGVMFMVRNYFPYIADRFYELLGIHDRLLLEAAALLHDIGQPAWSHAGELFPKLRGFASEYNHETITSTLIRDGHQFDKYFEKWNRPRIYDVIKEQEDLDMIAKLVKGEPPVPDKIPHNEKIKKEKRFLGQMIKSYCDFDRVAYLIGDSFFLGSHIAPFSDAMVYPNIGIIPIRGENQFGFLDEIYAQIFVLNRELSYAYFYKDPRDVLAREMLARAWNKMFPLDMDIYELWFSTDSQLLDKMKNCGRPFVTRIATMIESHQIYDIARIIYFKDLDPSRREKLEQLDQNRIELLGFEEKVCNGNTDAENLIIGISIHKTPEEVYANVLDRSGNLCKLGQYTLMKPLYDPAYCHERSFLIIGTFNLNKTMQEQIIKTILEELRK